MIGRVARGIGRAASIASGYDVIAGHCGVMGGGIRPAAEGAALVGTLFRALFRAETSSVSSSGDGARDFADAMVRHGVEESQLPAVERAIWRRWALYVLLATFWIAGGLIAMPSARAAGVPMIGCIFSMIGITPILIAWAIRHGVTLNMIRARDFSGARIMLKNPATWMPASPPGALPPGTGTMAVLVLALGSLLPAVAYAATAGSAGWGAAPATDPSLGWVDAIIPTSASTPWSVAVGTWSGILLSWASAPLAWSTVSGVIATAHTGSILGKWHQMWAPIRVTVGAALMATVLPSGLTLGHGMLNEGAKLGISWADQIQSAFIHASLTGSGAPGLTFAPTSLGGRNTVEQVGRMEVCSAVFNWEHQNAPNALRHVPIPDPAGHQDSGGNSVWDYGKCGGFEFDAASSPDGAQAYASARAVALGVAVTAIRPLAGGWAAAEEAGGTTPGTWPTDLASTLYTGAGQALDAADTAAARAFVSTRSQSAIQSILAASDAQGWTSMGSTYRIIGTISGQVAQLAASAPTVRPPGVHLGAMTDGAVHRYDELLASVSNADPTLSGTTLAAPGDQNSDVFTRLLAPVTKPLAEFLLTPSNSATTQVDPMSKLISSGHTLLSASEAAIVAGGGVALASGNIFSQAAGAGAVWSWASQWATIAIFFCISIAIVHAFVLPMLPYLSALYMISSYVIYLVECCLAVVLWSFIWLRLDGQDLVDGPQRPGAILLMNVLLRPSLAVLAMASTYVTLPVILGWVDSTYAATFVGSQGGHTTGLVGLLVGLSMLSVAHYQICVRLIQAVHLIPDSIARWFGGQAASYGEAEAAGRASGGLTAGVLAGGKGASSAAGGGGGPGKGPKRSGGGGSGAGTSGSGAGGGGASSFGSGPEAPSWMRESGGLESLSPSDQAAAEESHADWINKREAAGKFDNYDLPQYVQHSQGKEQDRVNKEISK